MTIYAATSKITNANAPNYKLYVTKNTVNCVTYTTYTHISDQYYPIEQSELTDNSLNLVTGNLTVNIQMMDLSKQELLTASASVAQQLILNNANSGVTTVTLNIGANNNQYSYTSDYPLTLGESKLIHY